MDSGHLKVVSGFLRTHPVKIIAGQAHNHYYVHIGALKSSESASLANLVSSTWNGTNKPIDWSHWDTETVEMVLTWLCARTYQICNPSPLLHEASPELNDVNGETSRKNQSSIQSEHVTDDREKNSRILNGDEAFDDVPNSVSSMPERSTILEIAEDPQNNGQTEARIGTDHADQHEAGVIPAQEAVDEIETDHDTQQALLNSLGRTKVQPLNRATTPAMYQETVWTSWTGFDGDLFDYASYSYSAPLLSLAQLHAFAIYHLCEPLQESTLHQLKAVLDCVDCSQPHAVADLEELVKYTYANIPAETPNGRSIRKHLPQFLAINYADLRHHDFDDFVFSVDELTVDFAREISQLYLRSLNGHDSTKEKLTDARRKVKEQENLIQKYKNVRRGCKRCGTKFAFDVWDEDPAIPTY